MLRRPEGQDAAASLEADFWHRSWMDGSGRLRVVGATCRRGSRSDIAHTTQYFLMNWNRRHTIFETLLFAFNLISQFSGRWKRFAAVGSCDAFGRMLHPALFSYGCNFWRKDKFTHLSEREL
jgi:hypothetical protein